MSIFRILSRSVQHFWTLAYSSGIFQGNKMRKKQVQKYVSRRKEPKKRYRRRSTFGVGLDG
jgi:hypothetical protein